MIPKSQDACPGSWDSAVLDSRSPCVQLYCMSTTNRHLRPPPMASEKWYVCISIPVSSSLLVNEYSVMRYLFGIQTVWSRFVGLWCTKEHSPQSIFSSDSTRCAANPFRFGNGDNLDYSKLCEACWRYSLLRCPNLGPFTTMGVEQRYLEYS